MTFRSFGMVIPRAGGMCGIHHNHMRARGNMLQSVAESSLKDWANFYVVTGSAAAALTGLQFVVMALVHDMRRPRSSDTIDAFETPNIVNYSAVLLVSAAMSAPWHVLSYVALLIGACGIAGVLYGLLTVRRTKRQPHYTPVLEDWIWHVVLPVVSYAALIVAATMLLRDREAALFMTGAASLLLLFIGIHNAWDTVIYIVTVPSEKSEQSE